MILGITGGSGCGKTTLLNVLQNAGVSVLDCDAIYHQLLETDQALLQAIEARFPGTVESGILNRKKLGKLVFSDSHALSDLNAITHGAVKEEVLQRLSSNCAIDAFALFESGLAELCHVTVAVTAPVEDRVNRLMQRDGISREYASNRIASQKSNAEFSTLCNYTLENTGDLADFQTKCLAFCREIGII